MMPNRPIALSVRFLKDVSGLTVQEQKRVHAFLEQALVNLNGGGLQFKRVQGNTSGRVYELRVTDDFRAIGVTPTDASTLVLVHLDHHDAALKWAAGYTVSEIELQGAVEIMRVLEGHAYAEQPPDDDWHKLTGLFAKYTDDELVGIELPRPLLPAVRSLVNEDGLLALYDHLDPRVGDALLMLADQHPLVDVQNQLREREREAPEEAMASPPLLAGKEYVRLAEEEDLAAMLQAPESRWRIWLHPDQRRVAYGHFNGPALVQGGAGTGKTIAALHRARYLATEVFTTGSPIFLCTFTTNLAKALQESLALLLEDQPAALEQVVVTNLHRWTMSQAGRFGLPTQVAEGQPLDDIWQQVNPDFAPDGLSQSFCREEWEQVVEARGIATRSEYLYADRTGRGTPLTVVQRKDLWQLFEAVNHALSEDHRTTFPGLSRRLLQEYEKTDEKPFAAVVVDETQDLKPVDLRLIRALAPEGPNDLFLVGDPFQRIYGRSQNLKQCGIHVTGRSRRLRTNYRTTRQIREWAVGLLTGQRVEGLAGERAGLRGERALLTGPDPQVETFTRRDEEVTFVVRQVERLLDEGVAPEAICLTCRSQRPLTEAFQPALTEAQVPSVIIGRDSLDADGVRLASMHRIKGFEFGHVLVVDASEGCLPHPKALVRAGDQASREDLELAERCMLYVAATRAKATLTITASGQPSRFIAGQVAPPVLQT